MTDMIFTYANCAQCSRICRGAKVVPRTDAQQSANDAASGRTVADRVTDDRYPADHLRPVCSECEVGR